MNRFHVSFQNDERGEMETFSKLNFISLSRLQIFNEQTAKSTGNLDSLVRIIITKSSVYGIAQSLSSPISLFKYGRLTNLHISNMRPYPLLPFQCYINLYSLTVNVLELNMFIACMFLTTLWRYYACKHFVWAFLEGSSVSRLLIPFRRETLIAKWWRASIFFCMHRLSIINSSFFASFFANISYEEMPHYISYPHNKIASV